MKSTVTAARLTIAIAQMIVEAGAQVFEIRDTARWDNSRVFAQTWAEHGSLGLLYANGVFVDSVDVAFGLRPVHGGVVFQVVRAERVEGGHTVIDPMWQVYHDGTRTQDLHDLLPEYSWIYSSPSIIDSVVYYWGITVVTLGHWRLSAGRYDFRSGAGKVVFVSEYFPETDTRWFLARPERDGRLIRYRVDNTTVWFDRDLNLERREP